MNHSFGGCGGCRGLRAMSTIPAQFSWTRLVAQSPGYAQGCVELAFVFQVERGKTICLLRWGGLLWRKASREGRVKWERLRQQQYTWYLLAGPSSKALERLETPGVPSQEDFTTCAGFVYPVTSGRNDHQETQWEGKPETAAAVSFGTASSFWTNSGHFLSLPPSSPSLSAFSFPLSYQG